LANRDNRTKRRDAAQEIPDLNIDIPVDASALETLGLASLLTKQQIANQGLKKRVEHAKVQANRGGPHVKEL
jgi:hypothetical protein